MIEHDGKLLLYCATRDPSGKTQMLVGAEAPRSYDFGRGAWTQFAGGPVLKPELPWENRCIEAPSVCRHNDRLYMFYAGAYNNQPQQIGVAASRDVNGNASTLLAGDLAPGAHTVTIRVTGRKRAESLNTYVQIVGFGFRQTD